MFGWIPGGHTHVVMSLCFLKYFPEVVNGCSIKKVYTEIVKL